MTDYLSMYDPGDYITYVDLKGRDVTVTIARVEQGQVVGEGGRISKMPVVFFAESKDKRGLALNKTNGRTVAKLYGKDVAGWVGKKVTLYPTKTQRSGEVVDCIRIRPKVAA